MRRFRLWLFVALAIPLSFLAGPGRRGVMSDPRPSRHPFGQGHPRPTRHHTRLIGVIDAAGEDDKEKKDAFHG